MEEIGKYVWLEEEEEHGWVPVKIMEINELTYKVTATINEELIEWEIDRKDFKIMDVHTSCLEGVDDLLMLGDFNEPTLLQNTRARYYKENIYSFIGSPILIAVNPYKKLFIDEKLLIQQFKDYFKNVKLEGGSNLSPPSPHLYYIGEASYQDMITDKKSQSIIISGESGSGKTESTKILLKYLATVSSEIGNSSKVAETDSVEKQVLDSNPLLEAFGNAKTVKNNNSSRFGKFIQINFTEFGKIISAKIFNYLLEKSRIVKVQHPEERNYHIFYQFLFGANEQERTKFQLKDPTYYKYLKSDCFKIEDEDDAKNFLETKECMTKLKFNEDEKKLIFSLLSGILYLGNVEFEEVEEGGKTTVKITEESTGDFKLAADFMGLESDKLNKILTIKKYTDPLTKNVLERVVSIDAANNSRDAISKAVYAKMFDWIIKKINLAIANTEKEKLIKDKEKLLKIGILDIFGFEIFEINSFEQLCINYANERLQQFFNNSLFKLEQDEYVKEKIDWSKIVFKDNKEIIDLIDNPNKSIFTLLDSEAMLKNTDDKKFRDNVYSHLTSNPHLISYKGGYGDTILINHYAGQVEYLVYEFIEKNNDQLNSDISEAFENSKNKLVKHLFKKKEEEKNSKKKIPKESGPNKIQTDSLSKQFRKQLDELLKMLGQSNPRYVKCIKPNSLKKPKIFESLDVNRQLLSAGVLEAIKIRKQGYSVRRTKEEFVRRYLPLTPSINMKNYPASVNRYELVAIDMFKFLTTHTEFKDTFDDKKKLIQIGLSKIFMKDEVKNFLEFKLNQAVMKYIVKIQTFSRRFLGKKKMKKKRIFSLKLQKNIRGYLIRHKKLVCFHLKNQGKEFKNIKLEEKRKKEEEELRILEEENRKKVEEQKKFQAEMKQQVQSGEIQTNNKPIENHLKPTKLNKKINECQSNISNKDSYGGIIRNILGLEDISTSDIQLINALQGVKKEKKPKKHLLADLLTNNNNPVLEDILKKQIESLQNELNMIKNEKDKLANELDHSKEVNVKKEKEIDNLKNKLNNSSSNIKSQLENLNEDVDKINSEFTTEMNKKKSKLLEKSDLNINSNITQDLKISEDEIRKLKRELNEKESTIEILNLKSTELTKNNKSLNDLNENLKEQINKGKERLNNEMKQYYDHIQEIEMQKTQLERKVRDLETKKNSSSNLPLLNISVDKSTTEKDTSISKSQISELKKENKNLTKKLDDYKSKFEKEINTLKNTVSMKESRIKELENRQKVVDDDLQSKTDQYDTIKSEYDLCKDKISEMKVKLDGLNTHSIKLKEYEIEVTKVKNELENNNRKKDGEIRELQDSLDKHIQMNDRLKKIEFVLKEELNNKESELAKRQELIKYYQDEYDKISDENMKIKKENLTYKGKLEILEVDYKNKYESEIKMKSQEILGLKEKSRTYEKLVNELKEILKKKQRIIDFKKQINLMLVELLKLKRTEVQYLEAHKYTNSSNLKENIAKIKENEQDLLNKMNEMTNNPDYTDSEADEEEENEEDSFESSNDFQN